ncbi:MAG: FAD-dependent thymidylate synthase [Patescibacteria group bacterium]|nr:FAD-dependent thymidylate synthase [Patescibacteria group bacterium]MDE1945797.1 FAD-dependent thymidylate synthase [Patescibacteria group bacterium]
MGSRKSTRNGSVTVELLAHGDVKPDVLTSHAALGCYQATPPEMGKLINIKNKLFYTGHHTTLQHWYATFLIEGIAVGDITFGMHEASPFYNSDQRSGRYCSAMFADPDFAALEHYIREFWPEVGDAQVAGIMTYIRGAIEQYTGNLEAATALSKKHLIIERPKLPLPSVEANCAKIAQEQMRMFIPIIFPTGFDFTVNLSALVSLWASAWNPTMRAVTDLMRDLVLERFPEIAFMFAPELRVADADDPDGLPVGFVGECLVKPEYRLEHLVVGKRVVEPDPKDMHPIDLLHFKPKYMDNIRTTVTAEITLSCATMGQDQRHRTIERSKPAFVGFAYLPPLLAELGLGEKLRETMKRWAEISRVVPKSLATILAPYGAMVRYHKHGNLNALAHEMAKRCCWLAQEEIYHLGTQMREQVLRLHPELHWVFAPPCVKDGGCGEGQRYCGVVIQTFDFSERKV